MYFLDRSSIETSPDYYAFIIDGKEIKIPGRVYTSYYGMDRFLEPKNETELLLFTRCSDGYAREKWVKKILESKNLKYIFAPYFALILSEYIIEICEVILADKRVYPLLLRFFYENLKYYKTFKSKVISYWSVYYRSSYFKFTNYPLFQLLSFVEDSNLGFKNSFKSPKIFKK